MRKAPAVARALALGAAAVLSGCAYPLEEVWLDAALLGDARSILTVLDGQRRVRRALDLDRSAPLILPDPLVGVPGARVEVHAMLGSLAELRLPTGLLPEQSEGDPLPAPLVSLGIELDRGTEVGWRTIGDASIADVRVPTDCAPFPTVRLDSPVADSGVWFGVTLGADLLLSYGTGALLRFSPGAGFSAIDLGGPGPHLTAAAVAPSGTLLLAEDSGRVVEARIDADDRLSRTTFADLGRRVESLAVSGQDPLEIAAIVRASTATPADLVRARAGGPPEILRAGLDPRAEIEGVGGRAFLFSQSSGDLAVVGIGGLVPVPLPRTAGIGAVAGLPDGRLLVGTSDGVILRATPDPSVWEPIHLYGEPRAGFLVEAVFPWRGRLFAVVSTVGQGLFEVDIAKQRSCARVEVLPSDEMVALDAALVEFSRTGITVIQPPT
ncbi:MAG: hypothetical protein IT384_15235 [Deltaproteobacteria bacterium]|nr:hypothetical protein [Deltaproteobacteria bacterium]